MLDIGHEVLLSRAGLDETLLALAERGYRVVGPTVRDQAIVYDDIAAIADLPVGWTDEQDGGHYRLHRRDDEALFGYVVGPHSWKQLPAPAGAAALARRADRGRPRDPAASPSRDRRLRLHRRARLRPPRDRRSRTACSSAGPTSIRTIGRGAKAPSSSRSTAARPAAPASASRWTTGPKAERGFDLALTELDPDGDHRFLVEVGTRARRGAPRRGAAPRRRASEDRAPARAGRRAHRRQHGPRDARPTTSRTSCCATSSTRAGTTSPSAA